jgi:hypothetical protein
VSVNVTKPVLALCGREEVLPGVSHISLTHRGTTPSATGQDAEQLITSVADQLQSGLMGAEVASWIWPTCPTHAVGLHAQVTDTGAGWRCGPGEHLVEHIGSLPAIRRG